MGLLVGSPSPLVFVIIVVSLPLALAETKVSADSNQLGTLQLCLEEEPDGSAILETPSGDMFLLFKADSLWVTSLKYMVDAIMDETKREAIFTAATAIKAQDVFADFPTGYKRVISITGLNASHPLQNNILVFHQEHLSRYKVNQITTNSLYTQVRNASQLTHHQRKANIAATLESNHSTIYWPKSPARMQNLKTIYNIRGSRIVVAHTVPSDQPGQLYDTTFYLLNKNNLDHPIGLYRVIGSQIPHHLDAMFHHILAKDPHAKGAPRMTLLRGGDICIDSTCVPLRDFVYCHRNVEIYLKGLAYWIQYETAMTFRTLMGGLIAGLAVSIAISLMFTYTQLMKMMALT